VSGYALARAVSRLAGRTRVQVGGVDVTYVYGLAIPEPRYSLIEPFAYGATSLSFPQVHAGYQAADFGQPGAFRWVREGAEVIISRVFADTSETIDYRGRVISVNADGRSLTLDVGGQFTGPASTLDEQNQMYRQSLDVGRYASLAAGRCGLQFSPWFGPATGIELTHTGGQSLLSWAQFLGPMSQDVNGQQRALMPTAWGSNTWGFEVKNYTDVHYVAFNDDARVVVQVSRDSAEAPNVIYGTGITPEGERITGAQWPHVFGGPAPDYPIAGGASFGLGTTDADTVNGDGIEVLYYALRELGFLPFEIAFTGTYTSDFVAAVRKFQRKVGLSVTGTMTTTGWKRLFNVDYTGLTINGARIAPLAFDPRVEPYLYGTNGVIYGRNPDYDPMIPRVERSIDFGSGMSESAMIQYAQGLIARAASLKNWTGVIRLNGSGVFDGSVAGADRATITADDLVSNRDIRPGKNIWIPDFDGGTLFHIAGVDIDGLDAVLTVDTQARDLVEVRQIMERDRESRRDVRRDFFAGNRPRKFSTAMITYDKNFGWLRSNVSLEGGKWNVVGVIAGQQGQVNLTDIRLTAGTEFAVAAVSREVTPKRLQSWFGNPLVVADESWLEKDALQDKMDERIILYAMGDGKQPCGYGNRRKFDDAGNRTSASSNGRLYDPTGWSYICAAHTAVIVYVAIYPDQDCTLKRGRILYPQLDAAA
jgi:hypothetical protein